MGQQTEVVDVRLPNGGIVGVEIPRQRGGNISALDRLDFHEVQRVNDGLAESLQEAPG
jgi:hypothetical protein